RSPRGRRRGPAPEQHVLRAPRRQIQAGEDQQAGEQEGHRQPAEPPDQEPSGHGAPTAAAQAPDMYEKVSGAPVIALFWNSSARGCTIGIHGRSCASLACACTTSWARCTGSSVPCAFATASSTAGSVYPLKFCTPSL